LFTFKIKHRGVILVRRNTGQSWPHFSLLFAVHKLHKLFAQTSTVNNVTASVDETRRYDTWTEQEIVGPSITAIFSDNISYYRECATCFGTPI